MTYDPAFDTLTVGGVLFTGGSVVYTLPTASTSVLGGVRVDGTTVTISGGVISAGAAAAGVASFNTRTGTITLSSADVTTALTFTPYNATNPTGYQTAAQVGTSITAAAYSLPTASTSVLGGVKVDGTTVTIASGVISASGVASGVATFNTRSGTVVLTSGDVTAALTFTPYNATNPSAFISSAGAPVQSVATRTGAVVLAVADVSGAAPLASPTFTGTVTIPGGASISGFAPLASPTFTGTPTLPTGTIATTQTAGNSTTAVATTAFSAAAVTVETSRATTAEGLLAPKANPTFTAGLFETRVAMAALNLDMQAGSFFTKTLTAISTFTVSNVPAAGVVASVILDLTNGGAFAITWWSGMKWAGGAAPTLTASGRDVLGFFTLDGGTTWSGLLLGKGMA